MSTSPASLSSRALPQALVSGLLVVLYGTACGGSTPTPQPTPLATVTPPTAADSAAAEAGSPTAPSDEPPPCDELQDPFCTLPGGGHGRCLDNRCLNRRQCHERCESRVNEDGSCEDLAQPCGGGDATCDEQRSEGIAQCRNTRSYLLEACIHEACFLKDDPDPGSQPPN